MKWITWMVLAVGVWGLVGGCKDKGQRGSSSEILIGEFASMTGATATFGQSSHEGLMLAVEQVNEKGGVLGKKVKVISEDNRSDANEAVTAVQKLISRDRVVAVIGEVASKRSLAGGGVCQQYKIPMLSPASTNPTVTQVGDYIFRICFTDDFQGGVCAKFAEKRGWKKVAIFTDVANDYSKGLTAGFKDGYQGTIVADESFREGDNDFKAQLTKIKATGPDAVFLPGYYTDVVKVVKQARQLELNVPFFGGDGWDSPTTLAAGAVMDGCFYTDHYSPDDPRPAVREFIAAYQKKYARTPDAMAILGYDAGMVMMDAIKRAGKSEPAAIRDALAATKGFPGASGTITIDEKRNARKPAFVLELKGGKTHIADTIEPG
ncbi:MAG: ABC transporter substrate-binding protein [Planctomycetota bacterium]|nr:ABC transporter substrate-binding protein [Planctomycetota bacterium]